MAECLFEDLLVNVSNATRTGTNSGGSGTGNDLSAIDPNAGYANFTVDLSNHCTAIAYALEFIVPVAVYIVLIVLVVRKRSALNPRGQVSASKPSSPSSESAHGKLADSKTRVELVDVSVVKDSAGTLSATEYFQSQLEHHLEQEVINSESANAPVDDSSNETLSFRDVTVSVSLGCRCSSKKKTINNRITGSAQEGELFAVIGPSGCGKTTLIDALAGAVREGGKLQVTGEVNLRGQALDLRARQRVSAYIQQDDVLPPTATVLEYLVFVAEIVLTPLGIARDERRQAVERLLDAFQLHRVRHSMIGDHSRRGISGGEMRRVSVAVGLLARPSVVFLDEPTTGLDSHNAMQLLHLLHRWANSMGSSAATPVGSSVAKPPPIVLSIHQPSPRLFRHFHRIMVLGTNGRVLFTGQPEQMVPFFLSLSIAHQKQLFSTSTVSDNGKEHTRKDGDTTDQVPDLNEQPGVLVNKEDTHDNQISSGAATDETKISVDGSSDASTEIDNSGSPNPSTPGPDVVESEVDNPAEFALQWCAEAEAVGSLDTVANAFKDWDKIKDSTPKSQDAVDVQPNSNSTLLAQQLALFGGGGGGGRQVGLLQTLQEGDVRNEGENDSVCPRQPGCGERGYCLELTLLLHRDFEEVLRDFQSSLGSVLFTSLLAIFIGVVFFNAPDTLAGVINRAGLFFFSSLYFLLTGQVSLVQFHAARRLFLRERASKLYSPAAYFTSKLTIDVVLLRVIPACFYAGMVHLLVQLRADECRSLWFLLLLEFQALAASMMFLMIGAACASLATAEFVGAIAILLCLLFSGFMLTQPTLEAKGADWLLWFTFSNPLYQAMILNEFTNSTFYLEDSGDEDAVAAAEVDSTTIFTELGIDNSAGAYNVFVGVGAAYIIGLAFLGWVAIRCQNYLKS